MQALQLVLLWRASATMRRLSAVHNHVAVVTASAELATSELTTADYIAMDRDVPLLSKQFVIPTRREQAALRKQWIEERVATILPGLMDEVDVEFWVLSMKEYGEDTAWRAMTESETVAARRRSTIIYRRTADGVEKTTCVAVSDPVSSIHKQAAVSVDFQMFSDGLRVFTGGCVGGAVRGAGRKTTTHSVACVICGPILKSDTWYACGCRRRSCRRAQAGSRSTSTRSLRSRTACTLASSRPSSAASGRRCGRVWSRSGCCQSTS